MSLDDFEAPRVGVLAGHVMERVADEYGDEAVVGISAMTVEIRTREHCEIRTYTLDPAWIVTRLLEVGLEGWNDEMDAAYAQLDADEEPDE